MAPKVIKDKNLRKTPYNPLETVKAAPGTFLPTNEIKINPNNWMAKLQGTQDPTSIIGRLQSFFLGCPLYGALTLNPQSMYHDYLSEFWYTAYLDGEDSIISFTLKNGTRKCDIDLASFRRVLQLDYFWPNELPLQLPSKSGIRRVLQQMGHAECTEEDGTLKTKGTIFMKHLSDSWRYFFTHIVESLGGVSGV